MQPSTVPLLGAGAAGFQEVRALAPGLQVRGPDPVRLAVWFIFLTRTG